MFDISSLISYSPAERETAGGRPSAIFSPVPATVFSSSAPMAPAYTPSSSPAQRKSIRFGRCEVRPAWREVLVDGKARALQPRPFDLLMHMIENRDRVLSTDELLDAIWKHEMVHLASLASAIARIRKALCDGEPGVGEIIHTYPRVGYRFVAALDEMAALA